MPMAIHCELTLTDAKIESDKVVDAEKNCNWNVKMNVLSDDSAREMQDRKAEK